MVDGLNVRKLPAESQVDDKVESDHYQGVAEEPEYLTDGFLIRVTCAYKKDSEIMKTEKANLCSE